MKKIDRVQDLSPKQLHQLLEAPDCTKDDELSKKFNGLIDVYRFNNGSALLHILCSRYGVLYESVEDLIEVLSKHKQGNRLSSSEPDSNYVIGRYNKEEDVPIEQCRGIEHIDLNDRLLLVQASVEQVGQACTQMLSINRWERDVYGCELELINQNCFLVFQLRNHPWTLIQSFSFLPHEFLFEDEHVQSISLSLNVKVISYLVSDTGGYIGYQLYQGGESIERFYYEGGGYDEDRAFPGMYQFQSRLRLLKAEEIINPYRFTYAFVCEQDAYIPAISWNTGFKVGQKVTLQLQGLEYDDFERMDYLVLE